MAATHDPVAVEVFKSLKRTHDMFLSEHGKPPPPELDRCAPGRETPMAWVG